MIVGPCVGSRLSTVRSSLSRSTWTDGERQAEAYRTTIVLVSDRRHSQDCCFVRRSSKVCITPQHPIICDRKSACAGRRYTRRHYGQAVRPELRASRRGQRE